MIDGIQGKGASRANAICDDCGRSETVPCGYIRGSSPAKTAPDTGAVTRKLCASGWSYVKGKLRCPKCEATRKAENMQVAQSKVTPITAPKEPSKKQRLEIIGLLMESYDLDAERYKDGDTDDVLADVLGVPPGWVEQIRSAEFGPDGGNDDIESLRAEVAEWRETVADRIKDNTAETEKLIAALNQVKAFGERLDRIKAAIGPRNVKRSGL